MSFALLLLALTVLLGGIAWALVAAGLTTTNVAITCMAIAGIGIMAAVLRARIKDPSA